MIISCQSVWTPSIEPTRKQVERVELPKEANIRRIGPPSNAQSCACSYSHWTREVPRGWPWRRRTWGHHSHSGEHINQIKPGKRWIHWVVDQHVKFKTFHRLKVWKRKLGEARRKRKCEGSEGLPLRFIFTHFCCLPTRSDCILSFFKVNLITQRFATFASFCIRYITL